MKELEEIKFGIKTKISKKLSDGLTDYSKRTGRPKTWIIKQAIKAYLEENIIIVMAKDIARILNKAQKSD